MIKGQEERHNENAKRELHGESKRSRFQISGEIDEIRTNARKKKTTKDICSQFEEKGNKR